MIAVDVAESLVAQGIGTGVVVGMLAATAAALPLVVVDLVHREASYSDGFRPLARFRFPQAHAQVAAERRAGYRTRRRERARA